MTTRYFGYNNQSYMIPIIDMANHDNACPHWHQLTACEEGNEDKQCFVWVAGRALAEGEEVSCGAVAGCRGGCSWAVAGL